MTESSFASLVSTELPKLTRLLGGIDGRADELEKLGLVPLWQVERDLELLERYRPWFEIAEAYGEIVRRPRKLVPALYEIRVGAMLAPVADNLELAPAKGDLAFRVGEDRVFVEVTTAQDEFPPAEAYKEDLPRFYSRATVDPAFCSSPGVNDPVPFSTALRQRIRDEVTQLPIGQMTVVVLGCPGGRSLDAEYALSGDEWYRLAGRGGVGPERVGNGLFTVPDDQGGVSRLSAVVWMKLARHFHDLRVYGRLFTNPRAVVPLSQAAIDLFLKAFDRRETLRTELERIKVILAKKYSPERIILFGSLAEERATGRDRVHAESDIDLAIVKVTSLRFIDRALEVTRLVEPRVGLNVVVYTPKEMEQAEQGGNFFVRDEILKKGRVIFP